MARWVDISELAEITGAGKRTLYQRSRSKKALRFVKKDGDDLLFDADWFNGVGKPRVSQVPKTPLERVQAETLRVRRDEARQSGRIPPPIPEARDSQWDFLADPDAVVSENPEPEYVDYLDERRKWSAKIEEIKFLKLRGEILMADAVRREAFAVARLARDQFLAIPDRISGQLAAAKTFDECFQVLDGEIRRVLSDFAAAVEKSDIVDSVGGDKDVIGQQDEDEDENDTDAEDRD